MNNTSVYNLKNVSLSATILTTCLVMPLAVNADTSSSVDAIMEQLKAFKTQALKVSAPSPTIEEKEVDKTPEPQISTPVPVVKESKVEDKASVSEPAKEVKVIKNTSVGVASVVAVKVAEEKKVSRTVDNSAVMIPKATKTPAPVATVKKSKKRIKKKKVKQNFESFDKGYMLLIDQLMNEKPQVHRSTKPIKHMDKGISGWIYLGRYKNGQWESSNTLSSGSALPQAGQQYTVKSRHLNLRKSRPLNSGLGKLVKVLRAGEQISVQKIHRSSRNNYWANITR